MLIYLLENQNSLQILFFSDSLCLWLAKSCLITQMSSFFFIMAYFVQKKIGIFKKNKHMWLSILLPPAHKILTKKNILK